MTDELKKFQPKISEVESVDGELRFVLSGDDSYGFDKSLANAIRRVLLTDIPTVGFNLYPNGENNDLTMTVNNSSLHNEMLLHRIALMPLYINPINYMKNHLFMCKVKHDSVEPFKFVSMNDIEIYPLKSGFQERIDHYFDESYDMSPDDERVLKEQLSVVNIENYDLEKPLSQKKKDEIYRPYKFRGNTHYCLVTELKTTNTEDTYQEIQFYGSPSVGFGYQDAKFQSVSQATYSFKIDDKMVDEVLKDKIAREGVSEDERESYERKFRLSESERYFYRDNTGEANSYNFAIKSSHYFDPENLFKMSIDILIQKCENLKLEFIQFLKEETSRVSVENDKEYIYRYEVEEESHTLGNLIQSHMMRYCVNDDSIINLIGYKKPHPLEDKIVFIVSMNKGHKLAHADEVVKTQSSTTYILECMDELLQNLRVLYKISDKAF
jgi:DNA-directed RNA polymerase subunit L